MEFSASDRSSRRYCLKFLIEIFQFISRCKLTHKLQKIGLNKKRGHSNQKYFWRCCLISYFCRPNNTVVVAQLVRASVCGTEGRGFEPHHPPEKGKDSKRIFALFYLSSSFLGQALKC